MKPITYAHVTISDDPKHVHAYTLNDQGVVTGAVCVNNDPHYTCNIRLQKVGYTFTAPEGHRSRVFTVNQ